MQAHYFPTLHQFSYEAEDSRTPEYTPVRYGFDEKFFPEYSWKGYAVFSQLQVNNFSSFFLHNYVCVYYTFVLNLFNRVKLFTSLILINHRFTELY